MNQTPDAIGERILMRGIHMDLTPAMQTAIRDKFAALLRHNERVVRVHVRLHHEPAHGTRPLFTATGHVEISGPDIVASVKGDDAYFLLDSLVEKLGGQLSERHERRTDNRKHPHSSNVLGVVPDFGSNSG